MQELEKILEEIEQRVNYYKEHATLEYVDICAGLREAEGIIRNHMNDVWVSVEERLPEDDRMVLVTCQTKKGIRSVNRAYCDGAFWHGSGSMSGVIAWRPLPDPYRPERSAKNA